MQEKGPFKTNLKQTVREGVGWIHLAQDRLVTGFLDTVMNTVVP
jgi:hypothetical protein